MLFPIASATQAECGATFEMAHVKGLSSMPRFLAHHTKAQSWLGKRVCIVNVSKQGTYGIYWGCDFEAVVQYVAAGFDLAYVTRAMGHFV